MYNSDHSSSKEVVTNWKSCRKALSAWLRNGQPISGKDTKELGLLSLAKRRLKNVMPPTNHSGFKHQKHEQFPKLSVHHNKQIETGNTEIFRLEVRCRF